MAASLYQSRSPNNLLSTCPSRSTTTEAGRKHSLPRTATAGGTVTILGNLRGRRRKVARSYLRSAPRRRPRRKRGAEATRGRGGGGARRCRGGQCPSPEREEEERGAGEGGREGGGGASLPERASCWTEGIFVARAGNNMHIEVGHIHNNATRAVELFQGVKPDHGFFSWWQFFWGEFLKPRGHFRLAAGGASEWKCGAEQQVWSSAGVGPAGGGSPRPVQVNGAAPKTSLHPAMQGL